MNEDIDVDYEIQGNPFNQVLKQSLLAPQSERYVVTKREKDELDKNT